MRQRRQGHLDEPEASFSSRTAANQAPGWRGESYIDKVASDILATMPQVYDIEKLRKRYGLDITPTTIVLVQELERFNNLTTLMVKSLTTLQRALAGEVSMSGELEKVATALYNGAIPHIWRRLAPATLKSLGNWIPFYLRRNQQYKDWVEVEEPERHSGCLRLHLHRVPPPTALVQATCRNYGWPLDKSTLFTSVTEYSQPDEMTEVRSQQVGSLSLSLFFLMCICSLSCVYFKLDCPT